MPTDLSVVRLENYRGPVGLLTAATRITLLSPLHVLRGRRLLALGILVAVPPLIAAIALFLGARDAGGPTTFRDFLTIFYVNAINPLVALFLAGSAIGDDVDDGTVLYLRLRPVPRSAIVIGRFLAAWFSTIVLVVPSLVVLYLLQIGSVGFEFVTKYHSLLVGAVLSSCVGAGGFCALFLFLGLLSRRAVIYGVIITMVQDILLAVKGPAAWLSVNLYVIATQDRFNAVSEPMSRVLANLDEVGFAPTYSDALLTISLAMVVLIALSCWIFASNEYLEKPGE